MNLASYASVIGRTEEAKARLRRAIDSEDKDARRMALEVEDLRPLWDWLTGLGVEMPARQGHRTIRFYLGGKEW